MKMRNLISVPAPHLPQVLRLCHRLNPKSSPLLVPITPEPDAKPLDCFEAVRAKVARDGGRIQFGWTIWEWPRVFIEAEHHAVYVPPFGDSWRDITPSPVPELSRCLFLPDDSATYCYGKEGDRRDNVRLALADDPKIREFFELVKERNALVNSLPGVGQIEVDDAFALHFAHLQKAIFGAQWNLGLRYTGQNERCICGSGEKFKRCHGQKRS